MSKNYSGTEEHDCDKEHSDMSHDEWEASQDTPKDESWKKKKKMKKEEPVNSTGSSVAGTGDDTTFVKKKKKKYKATYEVGRKPDPDLTIEDRNYRKEYDNYHAKPDQRERNAGRLRARRLMAKLGKVSKGDKMDVHHKDNDPMNNEKGNLSVTTQKYNRTEPRLREDDSVVHSVGGTSARQPDITPDSQFAGVDVFNVNDNDFNNCKFGKRKHKRWSNYVDVESESGKRIYGYAKKNPNKSIIVQHNRTGHMIYLKKYDMGGET